MNQNLQAELWSFAWIFIVSGSGFAMHRYLHLGPELTRKFIHILVSFWVFILVYAYDSIWWAISGPVMFIFVNAFFGMFGFGRKLMGMEDGKRNIGLVCYPVSLLILTVLMYRGAVTEGCVIASVLIMGLGDGLAAVVGSTFGKHRVHSPAGTKSIEGSITMMVVSFLIVLSFTPMSWYLALTVGAIAALSEFFAPPSVDNITVPLLSALAITLFL